MKKLVKIAANAHHQFKRIVSRVFMHLYKARFKKCGDRVIFDPISSNITYESVEIGKCVFIGGRAWFSSDLQNPIRIGSYVMFGPSVTLLCGDHEIHQKGIPMYFARKDNLLKPCGRITIENDVWIGANATILKGVRVGEGAIIAAGSIVTKDVSPYTIVAGIPAKEVKQRFNEEEIIEHKKMLENKKYNFTVA